MRTWCTFVILVCVYEQRLGGILSVCGGGGGMTALCLALEDQPKSGYVGTPIDLRSNMFPGNVLFSG